MHSEGNELYQLSVSQVLTKLGSSERGLSVKDISRRHAQYGQNRLTPKKKVSPWAMYFEQYKNALTIILLCAAALILFVWYFGGREKSDLIEASLIVAIIFLITILGFVQEWKAEKAIDALKKLLAFKSKVVRDGKEIEIDVVDLVPGDLVVLEEGTKVPADIRLIEIASLQVNEASLTGESTPVNKTAEALADKLQIADQKNMVFSGTSVTGGRARGIVVATGDHTEIGKIASYVSETEEEATPMQKRLDQVGKTLGYVVLGICIVVFFFIMFFAAEFKDEPTFQKVMHSFIASVALAVAAIPEGLPAVVTISLALGTQRMLKRNVLVRKLNSIETLGSTDVICSDKTGTLTKGEMTVKQIYDNHALYDVSGTGYATKGEFTHEGKSADPQDLQHLLVAGLICNNAHIDTHGKVLGDPTEAALLVSAAKAGITANMKRLDEVPFSSERKMMSVLVEDGKKAYVYTKGAPEIVLSKCTHIIISGKEVPLTSPHKKDILDKTEAMATEALRTLGFAYKETDKHDKNIEKGLTFIGLQGMIDPPREEVKPLITQCHESGVRVIMITGDHALTAKAVAHEIGIDGDVATGEELDRLSDAEFSKKVESVNIYARVNPGFKMRIVEALKKKKHIVAMTGDGVNDAPALKKADIGVAMGITGTDVAKEASDMVLMDDHFNTLVSAIEEGRGVFDNIRKFVNYLLSCNIGEVILVFTAIILFQHVPLSATMLLWINVVTDGLPAIALGMDPAEKGILKFSPKKFQGNVITKHLWIQMILFGLVLTVFTLFLYWMNLPESQSEARAVAFTAIVMFELVRVFHMRSRYNVGFFSNGWLILAVVVSGLLQIGLVTIPFFANLFDISAIDIYDWLFILIGGGLIWTSYDILMPVLDRIAPPPKNEAQESRRAFAKP